MRYTTGPFKKSVPSRPFLEHTKKDMIRAHSSTMIVGPSGSGKMQLTEALLTEGTVFEVRKTRACHYCYAVWQPWFDGMKHQGIQVTFRGSKLTGVQLSETTRISP